MAASLLQDDAVQVAFDGLSLTPTPTMSTAAEIDKEHAWNGRTRDTIVDKGLGAPAQGASEALAERKRARTRIAWLLIVVFFGFGLSMFINGIATRILPIADVVDSITCPVPTVGEYITYRIPPLGTYLLANMVEPIYALAMGRSVALLALLLGVWYLKQRRTRTAATAVAAASSIGVASSGADTVSFKLIFPISIGVTNSLAYACYMALTSLAGVSIWSAMVGCYVVFPASYGMLVKHESRGTRKLLGIAACVVGAIMLGLAGSDEELPIEAPLLPLPFNGTMPVLPADTPRFRMDGPWWLKLLLYAGTIFFWSLSDGCSAYIQKPAPAGKPEERPLDLLTVIAFTSIGFALSAACMGGVSMLLHSAVRQPSGCLTRADAGSDGSAGYWLMFLAQVLGKMAWFGVVKLGAIGEASSFIPLVGLDVFIPAILGVIVLKESVGGIGYAGMALAAVGVALVSSSS